MVNWSLSSPVPGIVRKVSSSTTSNTPTTVQKEETNSYVQPISQSIENNKHQIQNMTSNSNNMKDSVNNINNITNGAVSNSQNDLASSTESTKITRFTKMLNSPNINMDSLRKLAWSGIPKTMRPLAWKILLGYVPTNADRRQSTLERKRNEYFSFVKTFEESKRDEYEETNFQQIYIDVPRTCPDWQLFRQPKVQRSLERILYLWAIRHPASGYVQGINDLATPFFIVFLSEHIDVKAEDCDTDKLDSKVLPMVEADCFWCMSKLLDNIQENYTFAQPGIQKMIFKLEEIVGKIDVSLTRHLADLGTVFIQFSFRWMNCLLMRELPLWQIVRMWDTYLCEGEEFPSFHVYVCASFLVHWSKELCAMSSFQDVMQFLQHLPTSNWQDKELELLLSHAFVYKSLYQDAPSHLQQ